MDYYTRHELNIKTDVSEEAMEEIEKYIVHEELDYEINEIDKCNCFNYIDYGYLSEETSKWYSMREDMVKMSLEFKNVLFEICGEGEDTGDLWKAYYYNGKEQWCDAIITFEEFDENKLKEIEE